MTHPDGITKRCHACKAVLPIAAFAINRAIADGMSNKCRSCLSDYRKAQYAENPEPHKKRSTDYRHANPDKCRESRLRCYVKHAAKRRVEARAYYEANRGRRLKQHRAWLERRRDYALAYQRAYNQANQAWKNEKLRRKRETMTPEQRNKWAREHPHEVADTAARCRARRQNCPRIERINRREVIERDGRTCYLCQRVLTPRDVTLDHVIPLARGGSHTTDNLRVCCMPCNSHKGKRLLSELDVA